MVALVHNEGVLRDLLGVDLVRVQEVDELRLRRGRLLRWNEPDVVRGGSGGSLHNTLVNITITPPSTRRERQVRTR